MALPLGAFVKVGPDIGKFAGQDGDLIDVEFFDAPVPGGTSVETFAGAEVRPAAPEPQTRIWWNDGEVWRIGRVLEQPDGNTSKYLIAFPDQKGAELEADEFYVRWSRPLTDPVRMLIGRATDAPFLQRKRSGFVREMLLHRSAADGLVGISSSGIELHAHQVAAARRVLLDPVRRYLLADEVGLGKTIEAGMVTRQLLLDTPNSRVVALVPDPLVGQWEDELDSKFHVQGLNGGWVDVLGHSSLPEEPSGGAPISLLIVDEAHRLTDGLTAAATFERLVELGQSSPALLLLSATPVRSNEDAFLRLLHLLDPTNYRLDQLDAFRLRIERRDAIGGAVSQLAVDTPLFLLKDAIDELRGAFPDDEELLRLVAPLVEAIDVEDSLTASILAGQLRHYVSDTYRVHRRMIRTRRSDRLHDQFPVRRREKSAVWMLNDPDARRQSVVESLDSFRAHLADVDDLPRLDVLRAVAGRCSAAMPAVRALVDALETGSTRDLLPFEEAAIKQLAGHYLGADLADSLREAVESDQADARLDVMADWAWARVNKSKVAACTSYTSVGRAARERMADRYGAHRVAALLRDMSMTELEQEYERARTDDLCVLLVCDSVAEEGWNLQFALEALHLDVPWAANRLEQRLGRFDRFSTGQEHLEPVKSTVVADPPPLDQLTGAWTRFLDEGLEVFTRSSATLQYAIPERETQVLERVIDDGFLAIVADLDQESTTMAKLRRHIEGQDLLDSVDEGDDDLRFFERLSSTDQHAGPLGSAVSDWLGKALNFSESHLGPVTRFGIRKDNPPVLSEPAVRRLGPQRLDRPYVLRRKDAGLDGRRLLRPGQPLLDAALALALSDGRGMSFARAKEVAGLTGSTPCFYFDILIGPEVGDGSAQDPSERTALQNQALSYLPSVLESIWFVPGKGEPPPKFKERVEVKGGINLAKEPALFGELTKGMDWAKTCRAAEADSVRLVLARESVLAGVERARRLVAADEAQTFARATARKQSLDEAFDEATLIERFGLVKRAVERPAIRIDSCGVVFLMETTQ